MTRRRSYLLVVLAVFALALAMRTIPLYWSPLPATLDGIGYAAQARDTIATGSFPLSRFRVDNFVFAGLLAVVGTLIDVRPLTLAQPLIAVVGAASCLTAVAVVRRFGASVGWPARRVRIAAVLVGVSLAVEGLYLRRTGVPDEEAVALLFLPLLAVGFARLLRTRRVGWGAATVLLLLVFPITHTFSTLIAALTVTALLAAHVSSSRSTRSGAVGSALVGGFWAYFVGYYEFAGRTVLAVPYVDRVLSHPGLFLAWLIVLVAAAAWLPRAGSRGQRLAVLVPIGAWFAVLVANVFVPVFPGTVPSPPLLTAVLLLFALPVALASRSSPLLPAGGPSGIVVVALLAAPVVHVYFSLTADLTPEFFGTVTRAQTFAHLPLFALASLTAARYLDVPQAGTGWRPASALRVALAGALVASAVLTAPIAFVDLDTLSYPSTTTEEEFAGASFAATRLDARWATDHAQSRMAVHYYRVDVAVRPVAEWLRGGFPPRCPVLSKRAWTTTGAHLFPAAPETIPAERYEAWLRDHNLVYATTGPDGLVLTRPRSAAGAGC